MMGNKTTRPPLKSAGFSLVVVRHPDGKWLVVEETRNRGFWLPGGTVEPGEPFNDAAVRETKEEAGIDVELVGVLRVEYSLQFRYIRLKTIYFAIPKDPKQKPKEIPDEESLRALWCDENELADLEKKDLWRGPELLYWSSYLNRGGVIYPVDMMLNEGAIVTFHKLNDVRTSYLQNLSPRKLEVNQVAITKFLQALEESNESWFLLKETKKIFNSVCEKSGNTMLHLASRSKSTSFIKSCIFISEAAVLSAKNEAGQTAVSLWKQEGIDSSLLTLLTQRIKSKLDCSTIKFNEI